MRSLISRSIHHLALLAVGVTALLLPAIARAADDAAKPAPAPVLVMAVKSADALNGFVKMLGIDLPPQASVGALEEQFPFVGKDGLATDKPAGVIFFGGDPNAAPEQMMVFVLPVKPAAATLDALKAKGAADVADHPDTVNLNGVFLRRTADHVLFSGNSALVAAAKVGTIADAVKSDSALLKLSADLKALRATMGDQYKMALDQFEQGAAATGKEGSTLFTKPIIEEINRLDRVELSLDSDADGVRLAGSAAPIKLPALAAAALPGMPKSILARVDSNYAPSEELKKEGRENLANILEKSASGGNAGTPLTDEQKKHLAALNDTVIQLLLGGDAASIGVEIVNDDPVVYIVQHRPKPYDFLLELRKAIGEGNALDKKKEDDLVLQTYKLDNDRVLRVMANEDGHPAGYMDVIQRENNVYIAISPAKYRFVNHLVGLADEGPAKSLVSGWLDIGKLVSVAGDMPGSPLADMPPEKKKEILDLLMNQKIGFRAGAVGDGGMFELSVSKGLLANAPKIVKTFGINPSAGNDARQSILSSSNEKQLILGCLVYANDHKNQWPDSLDQIVDAVGKEQFAKITAPTDGGPTPRYVYRKPADPNKDIDKTIVIYEAFAPDKMPAKVPVGFADGHIEQIDAADLKARLGGAPEAK